MKPPIFNSMPADLDHFLGGGFKYFLFSSLPGRMIHFDYFSNGLKPPTSFGMFELSFNLDLSKPKFVHEILTLRVQTRIDGGNIPSPRIGLVWGNPEILGHTWGLRPNILFCIISETLNRFCFNHPFFLVTLPCNKKSLFAMMIFALNFVGISVRNAKPPVEKPGAPGSTTGLSGACEMQVLAPEAVAGRPPGGVVVVGDKLVGAGPGVFFFGCKKWERLGWLYIPRYSMYGIFTY